MELLDNFILSPRNLKLKAADNLSPIRNQMMDFLPTNSRVIEFGCGNGDLLFNLSSKIEYALGIDKSAILINDALRKKEEKGTDNIDFSCEELGRGFRHSKVYDFAIASLFFHVIPVQQSIYLLEIMEEISDTILVCAFSHPTNIAQKTAMWLDQRFASHFRNYEEYRNGGYMEGLFKKVVFSDVEAYDTTIPFVKIYKKNRAVSQECVE